MKTTITINGKIVEVSNMVTTVDVPPSEDVTLSIVADATSSDSTISWTSTHSDPIADLEASMNTTLLRPSVLYMSTTTAQLLIIAGERIVAKAAVRSNKSALRLIRARLNVKRATRSKRRSAKRELENATRAWLDNYSYLRTAKKTFPSQQSELTAPPNLPGQ